MQGKVSIITGASSGIGKALAFELAFQGSNVVIVARRFDLLENIEKEIKEKYNIEVLSIKADVSIEEDCKKIVELTINKFNRIDILINNAGISQRAMFNVLELDVIRRVMDVNYWGTVNTTKFALSHIVKSKGSIVAISSISGFSPLPARTGYCSSKYAVHGFMETLRIEYLKTGVHIMVAAPEYVASEIREHALLNDGSEQGKSPREEKEMLTAEYVAARIVKGIRKKRRTMVIGKKGAIAVGVSRFFPKLSDKLVYYYIKKEQNSPY